MIANIVVIVAVAAGLVYNIRKMVLNVKAGKSIDGCDGDCSHCSGCKH